MSRGYHPRRESGDSRERQSPDWRFAIRQSGDWRSRAKKSLPTLRVRHPSDIMLCRDEFFSDNCESGVTMCRGLDFFLGPSVMNHGPQITNRGQLVKWQ